MIKFKNVAFAAAVFFGLMTIAGCQTSQSGSSSHAPASQKKMVKRISRSVVSPQPIIVREDSDTAKSTVFRKKHRKSTIKVKQKNRYKSSEKSARGKSRYKSSKHAKRGRSSYDALIKHHARANGVPYALAHAVVQVESGFRPRARGSVGEIGLMQLRKSTARGMGYRGSTRGLYHPETNIKYGMRYLGQAYKLGGRSTCGAILKYNAGHGARRMNPISRRYCGKVSRIMRGSV
jgi:hypothetical protein